MPQTLVLEDVVSSAMESALQGVWTAMPAQVESYDAALQRANVRVTVKVASVGEDGERDTASVAVINAVPVVHAGGGGFRCVFPVAHGDTVLLVFASRSIDTWLGQGGVVDPTFDHHHDISDAIAITGLRDFGHALTHAPSDHASIGHDQGATIELRQSEIAVGGDTGKEPTLKGTTYRSAEDSYFSALNLLLADLAAAIATLAAATPTLTGGPTATAAFNTAVGNAATAATAFSSAVTAFNAGAAGYLTSIAKVV